MRGTSSSTWLRNFPRQLIAVVLSRFQFSKYSQFYLQINDSRSSKLGLFEEKRERLLRNTKLIARLIARLSRRVCLAELIGKYIEETESRRAEPRKKRRTMSHRSSINDRFTDVLFPETIKCKGEQLSKQEKGQQHKRVKSPRDQAKETLKYWIQLGGAACEDGPTLRGRNSTSASH